MRKVEATQALTLSTAPAVRPASNDYMELDIRLDALSVDEHVSVSAAVASTLRNSTMCVL